MNTGSEHCIGIFCGAFEIHFVHYLASYKDMTSAVNSKDPNALAVLGVLVDVNAARSILGMGNFAGNLLGTGKTGASYDCFAPVVRNLKKVEKEDPNKFVTINEPIDFTSCAAPGASPMVYSYKGLFNNLGFKWIIARFYFTKCHVMFYRIFDNAWM